MTDKKYTKELLNTIIEGLTNLKGEDITIIDLRKIENAFCQYFIICNGNSNTHVSALADSVERTVKTEIKEKPFNIEGKSNSQWVLMDYSDIIVHVFQKEFREYYDLESLWGDGMITRLEIEKK